mmetsp:Transcript_9554/g.8411  ORF Transcript_9554/g.8411 Transcript_9554/m.8411 type:complete len:155 (-) Transcript_9554:120-584(-)
MVFSEKMGDAYTDSQHINDGYITLESRDLARSPYDIDRIKILGTQRDGSVLLFQKMYSNGSTITENYMKYNHPKNSSLSIRNRLSQASSIKKFPNMQKRNSQFINLNLGNNLLKMTTKQSTSSIRKLSTLKSIKEHPSEHKTFNIPKETLKGKS